MATQKNTKASVPAKPVKNDMSMQTTKASASKTMSQPMMGMGVPTGVKVISVLYYIGSVVGVIMAIMMFVGAGAFGALVASAPWLAALGSGFIVVFGIIILALSVLGFFVGRGLWKGKNWARIVAIILSVLGVLSAISGMIGGAVGSNILSLIVNAVIGGYLWFSKSVKAAFA